MLAHDVLDHHDRFVDDEPAEMVRAFRLKLLIGCTEDVHHPELPTSDSGTATLGSPCRAPAKKEKRKEMTISPDGDISSNWTSRTEADGVSVDEKWRLMKMAATTADAAATP